MRRWVAWMAGSAMFAAMAAVALLPGSAAAQSAASESSSVNPGVEQTIRLSQFLEFPVYGIEGEPLGSVEDILIGEDGRLAALVVEARDPKDDTWQIPWSAARPDPGWKRIVVGVEGEAAPSFEMFGGRVAGTLGTINAALASLVLEAPVKDRLGKRMGEVVDLRIDQAGAVRVVLFASDQGLAEEVEEVLEEAGVGDAADDENLLSVPWSKIRLEEELPAVVAGTTAVEPEAVIVIAPEAGSHAPEATPGTVRQ